MLNDLRDQSSFQDDTHLEEDLPKPIKPKEHRGLDQLTGTNARQRFILAVMLFIVVCLLGVMLLFLTGKVVLPITF
jgi:hypothetical protein